MLLYDSIHPELIPPGAQAVAGYGDGLYAWRPADWDRFPGALKLSIAVHPADQGDILDVERFDAAPADCPGWCDRFNRPGRRRPTIYCNRSTWPAVRAALGPRQVDYWIAAPGVDQVAGAVAVQNGGVLDQYDSSTIQDPSWLQEDPTMPGPVMLGTPEGVYLLTGAAYVYVDVPADVAYLQSLGVPGPGLGPTIDAGLHQALKRALPGGPVVAGSVTLEGSLSGQLQASPAP